MIDLYQMAAELYNENRKVRKEISDVSIHYKSLSKDLLLIAI